MLLPLAGIEYLARHLATIPFLIKDSCFFVDNGYKLDEMNARVELFNKSIENIGLSNRFQLMITRVAPKEGLVYDSRAIGAFISMFATQATINKAFLSTEEREVGSTHIRHFSKQEVGDIEFTFMNPVRNVATEYFLKADGEYIAPKDGTTLLPFDYYFKIELFTWVVEEGFRSKSHYIDGLYHLSSNISFEFDTSSEELQTFSVNFEKMKVGGITPPLVV